MPKPMKVAKLYARFLAYVGFWGSVGFGAHFFAEGLDARFGLGYHWVIGTFFGSAILVGGAVGAYKFAQIEDGDA